MKKKTKTRKALEAMRERREIPSDINGSYTGNPENGEQPVQDADDL